MNLADAVREIDALPTKQERRAARTRLRERVLPLQPGLVSVERAELAGIEEKARLLGYTVFRMSTPGPLFHEDFFQCIRSGYPLDPPLRSSRSWDALSDSLKSGLIDVPTYRIVIVWPDAAGWREQAPQTYETAIFILSRTVEVLADPRWFRGRTRVLSVFLADQPN